MRNSSGPLSASVDVLLNAGVLKEVAYNRTLSMNTLSIGGTVWSSMRAKKAG